MSNTTKRKQHYVPRFYLKLFADKDNKLSVYDFQSLRVLPNPVYYATQCYKKYFYGEDGVWENKLSEMEGKWARSVNKAINGETLSLDDISLLKEFVLYQRQRTSEENNRSIEQRESILKEYAQTLYLYKGWEFDEKATNLCKKRAEEDVTPAESLEMASRLVEYIDDLDILIVRYKTDKSLITSDSPVIVLNPFLEFQGFGFGNIGIAFLMPISPEHLLIVYDGTLYSMYSDKLYVESNNTQEVIAINKYELIHAERMAFSVETDTLVVNDEILTNRNKEEIRNKTQFLGIKGQRLIAIQARGMNYYYKLPYIQLPRKYQKIPYECREPLPREYEFEWEQKLAMKYQIMSIARKASGQVQSLSKTDLKIGCRKMESLAKEYWNNHKRRFSYRHVHL